MFRRLVRACFPLCVSVVYNAYARVCVTTSLIHTHMQGYAAEHPRTFECAIHMCVCVRLCLYVRSVKRPRAMRTSYLFHHHSLHVACVCMCFSLPLSYLVWIFVFVKSFITYTSLLFGRWSKQGGGVGGEPRDQISKTC